MWENKKSQRKNSHYSQKCCNFASNKKQLFTTMKQRYAVVVLFALIIASSMVSLTSYKATEELVTADMNQALAKALEEQQSDVISADTIQVFNNHLQIEGLRGNAVLAVDTKKGFCPRPQVSTATILSLSDQRPAMVLWSMALLWGLFCINRYRRSITLGLYGGLTLQEGNFVDANLRLPGWALHALLSVFIVQFSSVQLLSHV